MSGQLETDTGGGKQSGAGNALNLLRRWTYPVSEPAMDDEGVLSLGKEGGTGDDLQC